MKHYGHEDINQVNTRCSTEIEAHAESDGALFSAPACAIEVKKFL